jgi:hypothetical protein
LQVQFGFWQIRLYIGGAVRGKCKQRGEYFFALGRTFFVASFFALKTIQTRLAVFIHTIIKWLLNRVKKNLKPVIKITAPIKICGIFLKHLADITTTRAMLLLSSMLQEDSYIVKSPLARENSRLGAVASLWLYL